jgi:hypothetical protein
MRENRRMEIAMKGRLFSSSFVQFQYKGNQPATVQFTFGCDGSESMITTGGRVDGGKSRVCRRF